MSSYKDYGYQHQLNDHSHAYLLPCIKKLIHEQKNLKILDLGCGNGSFAYQLSRYGYEVYGTDASEQGVGIANQLIPNHFFVQDLSSEELPIELRDVKFNRIISTEVIEHLYDPVTFIRFAKNILQKNGGGELIISTPYHGYLKNLVLALSNQMDNHFSPLWDGGHIKFWSRKSLTKLLEENGFKIVAFKGCGRLPYLWKSMVIKASIDKV